MFIYITCTLGEDTKVTQSKGPLVLLSFSS